MSALHSTRELHQWNGARPLLPRAPFRDRQIMSAACDDGSGKRRALRRRTGAHKTGWRATLTPAPVSGFLRCSAAGRGVEKGLRRSIMPVPEPAGLALFPGNALSNTSETVPASPLDYGPTSRARIVLLERT